MKVAGVDGKFDEIIVRVRFEEEKLCELSIMSAPKPTTKQMTTAAAPSPTPLVPVQPPVAPGQPAIVSGQTSAPTRAFLPPAKPFKCTKCGGTNHMARYCRWRRRIEPGGSVRSQFNLLHKPHKIELVP